MRRIIACLAISLAAGAALTAQASGADAAAILARIDRNEVFSSIAYKGEMLIEYQGKRYLKTFEALASGGSKSFIEFTNPEDRGTKYLKTEGRLYVYSPDSEEVMLISGHLLKESMMGSDLSFEDTIENEKLSARYDPSLAGQEELVGRKAWVLELKAKRKTESYSRQRLWVDVSTGELLRYELYALSGSKLKEYNLLRSELFGERRFPVEFEMRDLLRKGSRTSFKMTEVRLDAPIPDSSFSIRRLGK
jgi:outer membrane lipoprotein-sorting protein